MTRNATPDLTMGPSPATLPPPLSRRYEPEIRDPQDPEELLEKEMLLLVHHDAAAHPKVPRKVKKPIPPLDGPKHPTAAAGCLVPPARSQPLTPSFGDCVVQRCSTRSIVGAWSVAILPFVSFCISQLGCDLDFRTPFWLD